MITKTGLGLDWGWPLPVGWLQVVARWDFCGHFWQFPSTAVCLKLNPSLDLFLAQQGWIFGGLGELLLLHSSIWRVDTFIGLPGIRPNISSSPTKSILAHLPRLLLQLLLYPRPLSLIYFFWRGNPRGREHLNIIRLSGWPDLEFVARQVEAKADHFLSYPSIIFLSISGLCLPNRDQWSGEKRVRCWELGTGNWPIEILLETKPDYIIFYIWRTYCFACQRRPLARVFHSHMPRHLSSELSLGLLMILGSGRSLASCIQFATRSCRD